VRPIGQFLGREFIESDGQIDELHSEANLLSFNQGGWLGVRKVKKELDARNMSTPESMAITNRLKHSTLDLKMHPCFEDAQKRNQGRIRCRFSQDSRDSRNRSLLCDHWL
jgi:hypothetical protein